MEEERVHAKETDRFFRALLLFAALATAPGQADVARLNEPPGDTSPRLAALAHEMEAGNRDALAACWQEMKGNEEAGPRPASHDQ